MIAYLDPDIAYRWTLGDSADAGNMIIDTPAGAPLFTQGTELAEIFEELTPVEREGEVVIHKRFPSSFAGTGLGKWVEGRGKKRVVLVGYMVGLPFPTVVVVDASVCKC